jgi:phosphohistidine phosphatase SixA
MTLFDKVRSGGGMSFNPRLGNLLAANLLIMAVLGVAVGETPSKSAVLAGLRQGGFVILMRHASSPRAAPDAAHANKDNLSAERQLDDSGVVSARAMGEALRRLHIPIGQILSSPTYRALETLRYAQLAQPVTLPELGDGGSSMQADPTGSRGTWLRSLVGKTPAPGTNTLIITHFPNISEAFGASAAGLADGEALILQPVSGGDPTLVARIKIEEWSRLDTQ